MIYENILKRYAIPHTVSIIGADISPDGINKNIAKKLIDITKKIYKLNNVEAASHTYSHPTQWNKIKNNSLDEKYRLAVNDYKFSLEHEIKGSLSYINNNLLPSKKTKTKTIFWSGDNKPSEDVLKYAYKNNK